MAKCGKYFYYYQNVYVFQGLLVMNVINVQRRRDVKHFNQVIIKLHVYLYPQLFRTIRILLFKTQLVFIILVLILMRDGQWIHPVHHPNVMKIHIMLIVQTLQTKLLVVFIQQQIALIVPMVVGLKTETLLMELQTLQIVMLNLVIWRRRLVQMIHYRLTDMTQDQDMGMWMIPQMALLIVQLVIISMKLVLLVWNVLLGTIVLVVLQQMVELSQHHVLLEHIIPIQLASI